MVFSSKLTHKFILFGLFLLLLPIFVIKHVYADGAMFRPDPYGSRWDTSKENYQQAYINYSNGIESMLLSIGMDTEKDGRALWIFPVPAHPNDIKIDVFSAVPQLTGEDIYKKSLMSLGSYSSLLLNSQIYPMPFTIIAGSLVGAGPRDFIGNSKMNAFDPLYDSQVTVVETINKNGITSELISAKNAGALYDYLLNKGLILDEQYLKVFDTYIGKNYSFVASWINSTATVVNEARGLFVSFPSEGVYFPLIPTSLYGNEVVPATLRITGLVDVSKLPENLKKYATSGYYHQNVLNISNELSPLFTGVSNSKVAVFNKGFISNTVTYNDVLYTKIDIKAPSNEFTNDISLPASKPFVPSIVAFLISHDVVFLIVYLWGSAIFASLFVGLLVFKELRSVRGVIKLLVVGVANVLTILGAATALFLFNTTNSKIDSELWAKLRVKKYPVKRRLGFIALFIFVPLFVISLFSVTAFGYFLGDLVKDLFNALTFRGPWSYVIREAKPLLLFISPSIGLLFTRRFLLKIKPEDQELFDKLTATGFSPYTFVPKDPRKIKFLIFFSLFIVVTGIVTLFIAKKGQDSMESQLRYEKYRKAPNFEVSPF